VHARLQEIRKSCICEVVLDTDTERLVKSALLYLTAVVQTAGMQVRTLKITFELASCELSLILIF